MIRQEGGASSVRADSSACGAMGPPSAGIIGRVASQQVVRCAYHSLSASLRDPKGRVLVSRLASFCTYTCLRQDSCVSFSMTTKTMSFSIYVQQGQGLLATRMRHSCRSCPVPPSRHPSPKHPSSNHETWGQHSGSHYFGQKSGVTTTLVSPSRTSGVRSSGCTAIKRRTNWASCDPTSSCRRTSLKIASPPSLTSINNTLPSAPYCRSACP
jgi:hypothetical protein